MLGYVAGFERGVLPIEDWLISTIRLMYSVPLMSVTFSIGSLIRYILRMVFLFKTSHKLDLPLPETPVMQVNFCRGISTLIFFKLFNRAPTTLSFGVILVLLGGMGICLSPRK